MTSLGAVRHRPVEPRQPAAGRVARNAGIGRPRHRAPGLERGLQLFGKAFARIEPDIRPSGCRRSRRYDRARQRAQAGKQQEARPPEKHSATSLKAIDSNPYVTDQRAVLHPNIGPIFVTEPVIALRRRVADARRRRLAGACAEERQPRVARGEATGIVGPSGSGKSTLLMVIAGLERRRFRHRPHRRRAAQRQERGPDRRVPGPQHRHRLPVLPPDPQHDGAGKRRGAAGARRPSRPVRGRGARARSRSA